MKRKRPTPISDQAIAEDWPRCSGEVLARLLAGKETYGDKSFTLEPKELTVELKQEALDIIGWGFILWRRLDSIEKALQQIEGEPKS